MDVLETITHPWREPIDYVTLVFWIVIFMIVAFIVADMLRVIASFLKSAVTE